ncbi:MAG: PAS domain S-box protein [Nitrospirae bacterium]|nr:PAS domain S-box protein [Nitrospirota bacterium]
MKETPKSALSNKLKTLTAFRALFVTVLLGTFYIFEIGLRIFPYPYGVLYLVIFLYLLTIVYSLMLLRFGTPAFAYAQLCLDVVSAITLVFLTGGIESWFSILLPIVVIASAIILNKRAGYVIATIGAVLYGSLIDLQFYKILPIPYDPMFGEKDFLYNIFSHTLALYLTAYLIGHLVERLERATIGLEKKDSDLKDLTVFTDEVIEGMPSGLFTTNLKGRIILFNSAAEEITGIERHRAIGMEINSVFPFIGNIRQKERIEGLIEHAGSSKVIGLTVSEMQDANGQRTGFIGIFDDLTELKRMHEEIKQKEKLADIGELAANIAHEIRNPLASLKGSIEMLKEDKVSAEYKGRLMEIALGEMQRLDVIITEFLIYSKPKAIELETFDLHQMLDETIEMLKQRNTGEVTFIKGFNGPLYIKADPQRLQQVFWNLGINAIEAMPDGGKLSISTTDSKDVIKIIFEDTGIGISPENMKKVLYPFFTTKPEGTGLGLSIAYRIVEDHNGGLAFTSKQGEGTKFRVFLPKGNVNGKE